MPAWLAPGLRRQVGLPLAPGGSRRRPASAAIVRGAAVAHRAAQHRQRQAVDLEEDHARDVGVGQHRPCGGRCAGSTRSVYVSSSLVPMATARIIPTADDQQRRQQRVAEPVDPDRSRAATSAARSSSSASRIRIRRKPIATHERQPQRGHDRRQHHVEPGDDRRAQQRAGEARRWSAREGSTTPPAGRAPTGPRTPRAARGGSRDARASRRCSGRTRRSSRGGSGAPHQRVADVRPPWGAVEEICHPRAILLTAPAQMGVFTGVKCRFTRSTLQRPRAGEACGGS